MDTQDFDDARCGPEQFALPPGSRCSAALTESRQSTGVPAVYNSGQILANEWAGSGNMFAEGADREPAEARPGQAPSAKMAALES